VYRWSEEPANWVVDYFSCASVSYTLTPHGTNAGPPIVDGGGESGTEDICDWFTTWLTQDGIYDFFQTRLKWQEDQGKEQGGLIGWEKERKGSIRKDFDNINGDERNLGKENSGEFLRWAEGVISSNSNVRFSVFWHTHRNSVSPSEGDININKKLNTFGVIVKPGLISLFGTDGKELCRADFP